MKRSYRNVTVLLPTLNEAGGIRQTIHTIRKELPGADICVVDGLSTDGTMDIVRQENVRLIECLERGKGVAVARAIKRIDTDYIVLIDADLAYPIEAVRNMIGNGYFVSVGERDNCEAGSISWMNTFGNRIITVLANNLFDSYQPDICSGLWVMHRRFYSEMNITARRFELEANLYTEACRLGWEIGITKIVYRKRAGESKLRWHDGISICRFLIERRLSQ